MNGTLQKGVHWAFPLNLALCLAVCVFQSCFRTLAVNHVSDFLFCFVSKATVGKRLRDIMHIGCHYQNDSYIKMGSDESHFNVSLIVRDQVTRQCLQTTTSAFMRNQQQVSLVECDLPRILLALEVRVTVGNSGLCSCVLVASLER